MTQRFILDENILINAQLETNEHGMWDPTCANLLNSIIDICHTLVLDPPLREKYLQQLNRPAHRHTVSGSITLRVLAAALQMPGKVDFRLVAPSFPEESTVPQGSQDDVPIVRLAVETRATLVTTDEALRNDLNSCGVQERYDLMILSPDQALTRL